jgi:sugar phosphate isomerase/epimerase
MRLSCVDAITPGNSLREKFENLERYGFEGIELWLVDDEDLDLKAKAREINEIAASYRVKPSSVIIAGPASMAPLDSENVVARGALWKKSVSLAADVNAVTFGAVQEEPLSAEAIMLAPVPTEAERKLLLDLVRDVGKHAEDVGGIMALEPVNRYENHFINRLDQAVGICEEVGIDNIRIMADTCEMNFEERDIHEAIERAGDYICHVHLAENNRLLPGYGHIDFRSIFNSLKKIGYGGYMALECAIPGEGDPGDELTRCVAYLKRCMS